MKRPNYKPRKSAPKGRKKDNAFTRKPAKVKRKKKTHDEVELRRGGRQGKSRKIL